MADCSMVTGVGRTAVDAWHAKTSETVNPLVQVGYRIRMKCLQDILHRFFLMDVPSSNNQCCCQTKKNLIVIGAGLDQSIGIQTVLTRDDVRVVEIDLAEICRIKRQGLLESSSTWDWIKPSSTDDDGGCHGTFPSTQSSYTLLPMDLNHMEQWQSSLLEMLSPNVETLVISELVLTYLSSCDALLNLFAKNKWHLVAYELLGTHDPPPNHRVDKHTSVLQSYRATYVHRFRKQLHNRENTFMEPLGTSLTNVRDRMKAAGFQYTSAQFPTTTHHYHEMIRNELANIGTLLLFDEHAALVLHLQSYVVSISSTNWLLYHRLCGEDRPVEVCHKNGVWLGQALLQDSEDEDDAIRTAFRETYTPLFPLYPAIRKLHDKIERESFRSNIGRWYHHRGGAFWMLVVGRSQPNVIGGIGIRKLEEQEATQRNLTNGFEIERLFVVPEFRGRGLSKILLDTAMEFAGAQSTIVATTLSILSPANQLYLKFGFSLTASETKGTLTYCTYTRYPASTESNHSNMECMNSTFTTNRKDT